MNIKQVKPIRETSFAPKMNHIYILQYLQIMLAVLYKNLTNILLSLSLKPHYTPTTKTRRKINNWQNSLNHSTNLKMKKVVYINKHTSEQ